jgi:dephospho-CoA kinase
MQDIKIIGISGTNGSGKDSLGQMLAERHGWLFVPATDILRNELRRLGQPIERKNLRNLGNEWRKQFGAGVLIDKAVELYKKGDYQGLAIASIRSVGEAERVHELSGKIVWVDASQDVRYERVNSRQRSTEDSKTFEQFLEEEKIEMFGSEDKETLNMAGVKAKADIFIENSSNDIEEFKNQAEKALAYFIK